MPSHWRGRHHRLWRAAGGIVALAAHLSALAAPQVAKVLATATVVQPASVMESFSPPMPLMAADNPWSTLKIVTPVAPTPQTLGGAASAQAETSQRDPMAGGGTSALAAAPVPVSAPLAITPTGTVAAGSSALLKGPITAALQVTPAGAGVSPDSPAVMRFIVAFN